jgi:hypothetical protein
MICLLLLQGYASIAVLGTLSSTLESSAKLSSESAILVNGIRTNAYEMKNLGKMTQFAYAINVKLDQKAASVCLSCHVPPDPDAARGEFATFANEIHAKLQALRALNTSGLSAEEQQPLDRVDQSTREWSAAFGTFLVQASARRFVEAHSMTIDTMEPTLQRVINETKEVEGVSVRSLARSQAETAAVVKHRIVLLLGVQLAIILPMVFFGWRFIRRIAASLRVLGVAAQYIAAGDADGALRLLNAAGL